MKKFKLVKEKGYFQSLRETKSVKELDDGAVEISGYASTKDKDRVGDVVEPKAFASALERYMTNPIVLLQHKADKPIGIVENADIDENGLYIKAKISQNTDGVIDLIKNGVLRAFSIGYSVKDYDTDVRELADGTYDFTNIIKDLELYEISVVSIPANPYALSKSIEDLFEVEEKSDSDDNETEENENVDEEGTSVKADDDEVENQENVEETNIENGAENSETENEKLSESEKSQNDENEHFESNSSSEDVNLEEDKEVVDENTADENSEIEEEEVEESSENVVETTTDDAEVVETHNEDVVETKSMETDSQKFNFKAELEQISKSFDEKLAQKDQEIEGLKSKVESMTKLFVESLETIDELTTVVKNTPVASGLAYKRPLRKGGYSDIVSAIKNL